MRVLIACEYSGVVRRAFREKGHDAWSCDLLPSEDESPYHFQNDILNAHNDVSFDFWTSWDLMIAHPPCTFLCNSGWHWTERELDRGETRRYEQAITAAEFFKKLQQAPIPKICIENPQPSGWTMTKVGRYQQAIQPYMFGDDASKRTCLWLKGLEPLSVPPEDTWVQPRIVDGRKRWANQTDSGQNRLGPSETRGLERSRTYAGIARAFVEAWG